jgi:2-oxo-4-hydroxy-4-carboxy-5-ureidoimidazoline decarboxylase
MKLVLADINAMDGAAFVTALGAIYENSSWVVEGVHAAAPFSDTGALLIAMRGVVDSAVKSRQISLIQAHPDLAGKAARARSLGAHSTMEQAGAGLDRLSNAEFVQFHKLNAAYLNRFQFPFVIAVRQHTKESILQAFEIRLAHSREIEIGEALHNIHIIAEMRLRDLIAG